MENIQNPIPPTVSQVTQSPAVAGSPKKSNNLSELLTRLKSSFSGLFDRLTFIPSTAKKVLLIALALVVIGVLMAILIPVIRKFMQRPVEETPVVDTAQLTLSTRKSSRYATDEGVLKIESDVSSLEEEMNSLEVKESSLNPPPLNWGVNFEE
jgi:hypothetical protein